MPGPATRRFILQPDPRRGPQFTALPLHSVQHQLLFRTVKIGRSCENLPVCLKKEPVTGDGVSQIAVAEDGTGTRFIYVLIVNLDRYYVSCVVDCMELLQFVQFQCLTVKM